MATTKDYLDYVLERLPEPEAARCRKMFGEYMVYLNDRPVLLVCDNTVSRRCRSPEKRKDNHGNQTWKRK